MIDKLKTALDPEIPVNVVDLGLIYVCEAHPLADDAHRLEIKMSMTAPGVVMGDVLMADAGCKVQGVARVTDVDIEIVWSRPGTRAACPRPPNCSLACCEAPEMTSIGIAAAPTTVYRPQQPQEAKR